MSTDVKKILDELTSDWEGFKKDYDGRIVELEKGKDDPVLSDKIEKTLAAISDLEQKMADIEKDETISQKLADLEQAVYETNTGKGSEKNKEEAADTKMFYDWIRDENNETKAALKAYTQKAVTIGSATGGGHAVPVVIATEIFQLALDISPIASNVRVTNVSNGDYKRLVDVRGMASGWVGEGDTRSETGTPTLQQVSFTHGELYANAKASNWSLNDMMFNVENWLRSSASEEYAFQLGLAVTSGDGSDKPTGILNGTPVSTDDEASPARAFGTIQYIPTGVAAAFPADRLGSPAGNPGDILYNTISEMKPRYLANAMWYANRTVTNTMRKWKDADGHYMWSPSLVAGQPGQLLGYSLVNNEHLADEGANAFPVIFADLNAGYEFIRIQGMGIIRDEVTEKGHTLFYMAQRAGGKVTVDDAIKVIKCATS